MQRDFNRLNKSPTGSSWGSTKGNTKSSTWREQPQAAAQAGADQLESSLAEKHLGVFVESRLTMRQQVPLKQRRPTVSCVALEKMLPAGENKTSFPSPQHWWKIWSTVSTHGLHSTSEMQAYWSESSEEPQKQLRDWSIWSLRWYWKSWDSSLKKRMLEDILYNVFIPYA